MEEKIRLSVLIVFAILLSYEPGYSAPLQGMAEVRALLAQTSEVEIVLDNEDHTGVAQLNESKPELPLSKQSPPHSPSPPAAASATKKEDLPSNPAAESEEKRLQHIEKAIKEDKSKISPRRTPLDFDNKAITLGEPYLGVGEFRDYGLSWFGDFANAIRPRAQFYGVLSTVLYGGRIAGEDQGQLGYNFEFDFNFDLTNTERFHVRYQPFVDIDEPQSSGLWRFHNDSNQPDHRLEFNTDSIFGWFEGEIGEMFDFISPDNKLADDLHIALGLIPLAYQNNFLMDDNALGVVLSKPNLVFPGTTRVHAQAVAAFDQLNAATAGAADKNDSQLYGLTLQIDSYKKYFELNYFRLQNTSSGALSQNFFAGSLVSSYGLLNYAVRAMFNTDDSRPSGDGQLYVLDINHPVFIMDYYDKNYVYTTVFYGTEGWNDISQGRVGRAGILFRGNGLTNFPILRNTGTDSLGVSLGLKMFFLREILSLNPEFSYLVDNSAVSNDQYAFGGEVQYVISNHFSTVSKLIGVHNENRGEDWGSFVELRFKF